MSDYNRPETAYRIDAHDVICHVDDDWLSFARENGADHLTADVIVGQSLWDFVTGQEVAHLYRLLIGVVRAQRRAATVPFRCDSPTTRRFMELVISPAGGDVEFRARLLRQETREPVRLLAAAGARTDELITMCSWCKSIRGGPGEWLELEQALVELSLLSEVPPPQLTHGICPRCATMLESRIADEDV